MKNDNDNLNQTRNIIILKPAGSASRSSEKKIRLSKERRDFLRDLAVMVIISAVVIAALITYELLK